MAPTDHADDHAILGTVSAYMVWGMVCFCVGYFYRFTARCTIGFKRVKLCTDHFFVRYFTRERRILTFGISGRLLDWRF